MDRYYTVMVVPEREKGVKSFRIPRLFFISGSFLIVIAILFMGILTYDYIKILNQLYENKHLTLENKHLKDQIQIFQAKINALTYDIERIHTFEKKLRIITGAGDEDIIQLNTDQQNNLEKDGIQEEKNSTTINLKNSDLFPGQEVSNWHDRHKEFKLFNFDNYEADPVYQKFKKDYEQRVALIFGIHSNYSMAKKWSYLTKQNFRLTEDFALFDYKFKNLQKELKQLEINIHKLDQFLLDRDSYLKSTPTIFPTNGWITSYYGPRKSPYSQKIRMHEGIDIGARSGTKIIAPADGIVTYSGHKPAYGNFIQIDHGYGIETIFGHAKKLLIKKGTLVKRGKPIALVGNTGRSTGPHLHYEVRVNGVAVDPVYFILR